MVLKLNLSLLNLSLLTNTQVPYAEFLSRIPDRNSVQNSASGSICRILHRNFWLQSEVRKLDVKVYDKHWFIYLHLILYNCLKIHTYSAPISYFLEVGFLISCPHNMHFASRFMDRRKISSRVFFENIYGWN